MGAHAGPCPIRSTLDQTRSYGIQADVRNCRQQMPVVHGDRSKPALKQMTSPAPPRINEIGIAPMRFPDGQSEAILPRRTQNEVNMIRHQTVGPHLNPRFARLFGKQISINVLVAILKEDWLPPIAALSYVMRKAGYHYARQSCHEENYHEKCAGG